MKVIECETACVGVVSDIKHAFNMKCWCYISYPRSEHRWNQQNINNAYINYPNIDGTNKTFNTKR